MSSLMMALFLAFSAAELKAYEHDQSMFVEVKSGKAVEAAVLLDDMGLTIVGRTSQDSDVGLVYYCNWSKPLRKDALIRLRSSDAIKSFNRGNLLNLKEKK